MLFADRADAGRRLAGELRHLQEEPVVVLGLPRGGVPVAAAVAAALDAPLDVIVVRKLGVPARPELAMGAIGEDGTRVIDPDVVAAARIRVDELAAVERRERSVLEQRVRILRRGRRRISLAGRTAVVVDDGVATGSTARAACLVARAEGAGRVVMAVPVAPPDWAERIGDVADSHIAVATPERFDAVGRHYRDFSPTTDDEVVECLDRFESDGS